jgi:cytochrome c oxidase subunit II
MQHAHMALVVVAETSDQFEAWMARQRRPAPPPTDPVTSRGRTVFLSTGCDLCHSIRGTDAAATVAPDLTHVASRLTLAAGTLPNTRGHLAGWILDPATIKPGTQMPSSSFAPEDFQALLAYLGTLR